MIINATERTLSSDIPVQTEFESYVNIIHWLKNIAGMKTGSSDAAQSVNVDN